MPTYTYDNTAVGAVIITVDDFVFKPGETREVNRYINDIENILTLNSELPYDNPIYSSEIYSGDIDDTSIFEVNLTATKILLESNGDVEFYRNSLSNTPPLILSSTSAYEIDNHRNIINGILKFLETTTVKITIFKRD